MSKRIFILLLLLPAVIGPLRAQDDFYDINKIQEIRIVFKTHGWKHILDSLYQSGDGKGRLEGDVTVNGKLLEKAGIRYKGYSSVNTWTVKNPFNIDLDYSVHERNYQGHVTLKLANIIDDPSFVREIMSYEIARKYMPASRANYANVYVNDTLIGLYSNIESVNKKFIKRFYPSDKNSLFKGDPAVLEYPYGQNANLAYSHGTDTTGYMPYYEFESGAGWQDLLDFIYVLNEDTSHIESVLNTDRTLWMHAFNYVLVNLDSYIGYSQNYYIYKDDNGRFNPILWDMNMSFASFRNSDGSVHFNGLSIDQAKKLNPLEQLLFSISPRPLMTNLFRNERYRKIFLAHMRTIVNENFRDNAWYYRGQEIQSIIDSAVQADPNKFYPYGDFHANLDSTVGGTGTMILYPGIRDFMAARVNYLDSYRGFAGAPSISGVSYTPQYPARGEDVWITAAFAGADSALLYYRDKTYGVFTHVAMSDDGNHHDGAAGDGVYGAVINPSGHTIQYYLYAENDSTAMFSPERAEYEYYTIQPLVGRGDLVINELMTINSTYKDDSGDYGSWLELCNNTSEEIRMKDMYLTDDPGNPKKWQFPDSAIKAKSYLITWGGQGFTGSGLHTLFPFPQSNGKIYLVNALSTIIDSISYGTQVSGKSIGRFPNGYGSFMFMEPTFAGYNATATTPGSDVLVYPNPTTGKLYMEFSESVGPQQYMIYSVSGQGLATQTVGAGTDPTSSLLLSIDVSGLSAGTYILKVICRDQVITRKFIVSQ
jgi:hypothetical protein